MVFDPTTTLAIYVVAILILVAVCAGISDLLVERQDRRARREARAQARAKRQREREISDAMDSYSWQD